MGAASEGAVAPRCQAARADRVGRTAFAPHAHLTNARDRPAARGFREPPHGRRSPPSRSGWPVALSAHFEIVGVGAVMPLRQGCGRGRSACRPSPCCRSTGSVVTPAPRQRTTSFGGAYFRAEAMPPSCKRRGRACHGHLQGRSGSKLRGLCTLPRPRNTGAVVLHHEFLSLKQNVDVFTR